MTPSIPGLLILIGVMMFTLHLTITARNYSAVGYAFLTHALGVFKEIGNTHEMEMLTDIAMPHIQELNQKLSSRIGLLAINTLVLVGLVVALILGSGGPVTTTIGVMVALYGGYALSKTNSAVEEVDDVCDACDQDLIAVNRPGEYQILLDKYTDDPVD